MSISVTTPKTFIDFVVPKTLLSSFLLVIAGAALVGLFAQISIPMWPVPITGQTFAVFLIAAALGTVRGVFAILTYLGLGAVGLPMFAGFSSGISFGATFGYLIGFVVAAAVIGFFAERGWHRKPTGVLASFVFANLLIYCFGLTWLGFSLGSQGFANDFVSVLSAGLFPFLIGDAIKIALAMAVLPVTWKLLAK